MSVFDSFMSLKILNIVTVQYYGTLISFSRSINGIYFTSISLLVTGFLFSNEVDKWNFILSGLKRKISLPKIPEDFKRLIELPISHCDAYSYPCKKCLLKLLSQLLSLLFFMNYKYKCNS